MTFVVPKGFVLQVNQPQAPGMYMVNGVPHIVSGGPPQYSIRAAPPPPPPPAFVIRGAALPPAGFVMVGGPTPSPPVMMVRALPTVSTPCRNGPSCPFRAAGACRFRH
jgi:hypothetical protein